MPANIPEHELPNWMKQAQRSVDWGALLALAFALLAAWSFFDGNPISASTQNEHFVFQASDIAEAMREGIFYPRWSPYAIKGYGAPIPHYYPQAAAYLVAVFEVLFTNDFVIALRLVYVLGFLIAGPSLYSLVAQRSNALAGIFAAVAYLFNPYLGLSVPHLLGDLPLFLGLTLIPLLLWIVNRLLLREQPIDVFLMMLISALFFLTIPRLIPQAFLLCILLIGLHLAEYPIWHRLIWILGGALLGLGLAAAYWLPALLEFNLVSWHPALLQPEPQRILFPEIFSQPNFLDSGFLTYENYFSLGWGLLLMALLSGIALILKREVFGFHGAFLLYGLALLSLVIIFPQQTELLASITLCFAIGGNYALKFLQNTLRGFPSWLLLVLLVAFALPYWRIPSAPLPILATDASAQLRYEASGFGIAVLPAGLAIPSNVAPNIETIFDDERLPDSNRLISSGLSLTDTFAYFDHFQVINNTSSQLIYQRAYFPGWEAWLDNLSIPITPTETGLMRLEIPASNASLSFMLGTSWLRTLAWLMTILALITALAIWWLRWRRIGSDYDNSPLLSRYDTWLVFSAFIVLLLLHFSLPFWLNLPSRFSLQGATYLRSEVDSNLQLLAYDIQGNRLYLYWEASRPSVSQYQIRLRLLDGETIAFQSAYSHPSYLPSNRWLRGFIVPHSYELPDGDYTIMVDVYRCEVICGEIGNPEPTIEFVLDR